MPTFSTSQIELVSRLLQEYLNAGPDKDTGTTPAKDAADLDSKRQKVINERLLPTLRFFLAGNMSLEDFKPEIDRINKQNELWGFKGIKGQMFFNLVFNAAEDLAELTAELKAAIEAPETEEIAKSRIRTFISYVRRLGDALVDAGGSKHARPKASSVPFFLSYFWQVQQPDRWVVYYTNSVEVLTDLNLLAPNEDLAEGYVHYLALHQTLQTVFSNQCGRVISLYDVEHVWWYAGQRRRKQASETIPVKGVDEIKNLANIDAAVTLLPDSYVPPVIAILPRLASNDPQLEEAANASGISIARAFEKSINAAFTILGFDTKLLGQGAGRTPDGIASCEDESYAILWDAKSRQGGYRMGTDDRTIREYITNHSRDLKRRRHFRNLYYFIVSSKFQDEFDDLIRGLKMDTDINEVCLIEADALVALVDAKLRAPRQFSVGPDGIQRLFCQSGIVTTQSVLDVLT